MPAIRARHGADSAVSPRIRRALAPRRSALLPATNGRTELRPVHPPAYGWSGSPPTGSGATSRLPARTGVHEPPPERLRAGKVPFPISLYKLQYSLAYLIIEDILMITKEL